jgi:hypothetical protein
MLMLLYIKDFDLIIAGIYYSSRFLKVIDFFIFNDVNKTHDTKSHNRRAGIDQAAQCF